MVDTIFGRATEYVSANRSPSTGGVSYFKDFLLYTRTRNQVFPVLHEDHTGTKTPKPGVMQTLLLTAGN